MEAQAHNVTPGSILVVDDNPKNLKLLSSMLTQQGYKVRSVTNGSMALTASRAAPPDLILLDINMPDMHGYEVCQQLKAEPSTSAIPVIFVSALDDVLDKVKAFRVGGVDYIPKPFQVEEVLVRVETHLKLRRLQQQLQATNDDLEHRVAERTADLERLNVAYERFVPRQFLSLLQKQNIIETALGDHVQREMTIMFSDMRSFTTLSETMTPQENFAFINAYLRRVSPIIRKHHGLIDKYIGDAIMALFPRCADDAVQAAIEMNQAVARYNVERTAAGYQAIQIGIGLHTGSVMLGTVGEEERMQGTVISDAVNVAARLEGLTKAYGASLLISEQTQQALETPSRYHHRFVDRVQVKGKHTAISVLEIFDINPPHTMQRQLQTRETFEAGLQLYHAQHFAEASVKFNQVLEENADDKAARLYLQRSAYFMVHGVPPDWQGIGAVPET